MLDEISAEERDINHEEYLALYAIFSKFLEEAHGKTKDELLESLMELRAELLIGHALDGFGMDWDKALSLLNNHNDGLTDMEKEQRKILVAAIDNLVDFAVAEEFQMSEDLPEDYDTANPEDWDECDSIFSLYNERYAAVENNDVKYALGIAAWWVARAENTLLTYMTQGDERVRPWHRALEGISYPKKSFPAWLIPPIEYGCRCFLITEDDSVVGDTGVADVEASKQMKMPDFINPVFKDSVAKGGRIFSEAHSYFTIPKGYKRKLKQIAKRIKSKWIK